MCQEGMQTALLPTKMKGFGILMKEDTYTIYKLENLINGKIYIGQTKNLNARIYHHALSRSKQLISNAIEKHGFDNFELKVLHSGLSSIDADVMECVEIFKHKSLCPKGYNVEGGGKSFRSKYREVEVKGKTAGQLFVEYNESRKRVS